MLGIDDAILVMLFDALPVTISDCFGEIATVEFYIKLNALSTNNVLLILFYL